MRGKPKFKTCEVVRVIDPNFLRRHSKGNTGVVMEIVEGSQGRWRYRIDSCMDKDYFYEEHLESTGQFD